MNEKLEGATEENVLTLLCWDEKHAPGLLLRLTPDLFSTRAYQRIAQAAFDYISKYSKPPRAHLRDLLEEQLRKGEEGKLLGQTITAMDQLAAELQPDYVLSTLERFIRKRRMTMAMEQASDALANDEMEKADAILYGSRDAEMPEGPGTWVHDPVRMLSFLNKGVDDYISCGVDALDDRDILLERKTMTLLIAPAKRGKSWWLCEVGKRALIQGKGVLHITLENSEELTSQRYLQSLFAMTKKESRGVRTAMFSKDSLGHCTGIEFDNRTPDALMTTSRAKLTKRLQRFSNRSPLLIKEFPTSSLTIPQLNSFLDSLKHTEGFEPEVLLVDYPDLMALDSANMRIDLGRIFKELRGIAVKRNLALATVTQGTRISAGAKTVTEGMVAEDFSKIGTADTVLTYSQTAEEKKLGLARVLVSNARNAEDKYIVLISQNYATGQFCLDSVYMNHHMETEIERLTGEERGVPDGEEDRR
jgi:replicative DNA helicase